MTTPPQNHELSFPLGFHSNFYKNRAPTLGEKRQKSVRFARDVLQFAAFCDTSRLKLHFLIFAFGLERERQTSSRDHQIAQKMLEFPTKRPIHLENESGDAPGFLKQLLQNSTPTLHGNAKKTSFPQRCSTCFGTFAIPLRDNADFVQKGPKTTSTPTSSGGKNVAK